MQQNLYNITHTVYVLCLKKVPTFKLSVTSSNLNRFSKFLHCWKAYEICYETHTTPPTTPQLFLETQCSFCMCTFAGFFLTETFRLGAVFCVLGCHEFFGSAPIWILCCQYSADCVGLASVVAVAESGPTDGLFSTATKVTYDVSSSSSSFICSNRQSHLGPATGGNWMQSASNLT